MRERTDRQCNVQQIPHVSRVDEEILQYLFLTLQHSWTAGRQPPSPKKKCNLCHSDCLSHSIQNTRTLFIEAVLFGERDSAPATH